jgi:ferredoxin-NADP reductase
LRAADGAQLPPFEPGAHIDVRLPGGLTRQYSLCNDASETARYCIGVGLSASSRGGSAYIHEKLRKGDMLTVGEPRALFRLSPRAGRHRFIAGGIGITPILAMIRWCVRHQLPWELHYCVRSRSRAAYLGELHSLGDHVYVYADDEGMASPRRDVSHMMRDVNPAEHIYCCGPGGLMDAVSAQAKQSGLPSENLHFERFAAPVIEADAGGNSAFTVVLARRGVRCIVESDESILDSVERHGVCPPFSCREGLCRSCEVAVLSGEADHRDYVLSDDERREDRSVMICVSRARSSELVIDL